MKKNLLNIMYKGDNMKKIIIVTVLIILIPYLVVTLFIKEEEIEFNFITNEIVRVKREDTNPCTIIYTSE